MSKLPRIIVRPRIPPFASPKLALEPQEMHWQILESGRVVREAEQPIHNILLDNSKELIATLGLFEQSRYAVVGTGSTAPDPSQTGLANEVARTNATVAGNPDTVVEVSPGVWEITRYRQFTAGQVGGLNLTEWGWSGSNQAGGNLMSRELFRDGSGNPITLTLDNDQQLRLIYKVRVIVGPTVPQPASINILGLGVRTGRFILLKSDGFFTECNCIVGILSRMTTGNTTSIGLFNTGTELNYARSPGPSFSYSQRLGVFRTIWQSYVPNSRARKQSNYVLGPNDAVGTIKSFGLSHRDASFFGYSGNFAPSLYFQFDGGQEIVKDNLHELTLEGFKIEWT